MKKLITVIIALLAALMLCGCTATPIAGGFSEETLLEKGKAFIALINTRDYEAVCNEIREDYREKVKPDDIKAAWDEQLKKLGALKEYSNWATAGVNDTDGSDLALIAIKCKYDGGDATFTFYYDLDYRLTGLYMK